MKSIIERMGKVHRERGVGALIVAGVSVLNPFSDRNHSARERTRAITKLQKHAGSDGSIIRTILGSKFRLDVTSGVSRKLEIDLAIDGIREAESARYYADLLERLRSAWLGRNPVILDIGANIGYYALLEARVFGDEVRVIAVEPDRDNAQRLAYNVALNGYRGIEVVEAAAGAAPGTGELTTQGASNLHKMKEVANGSLGSTDVEVITIDSLVTSADPDTRAPFIVRIDIEGFEGHAFLGMKDFLASSREAVIFVEIHIDAGARIAEVIDAMILGGFEVHRGPGRHDRIISGAEFQTWFMRHKVVEHVFGYRAV